MRPPSAAQSRAGAVAPAPRGFPVVACPDSIARDTRCLLLTHTSIMSLALRAYVRSSSSQGDLRKLPAFASSDIVGSFSPPTPSITCLFLPQFQPNPYP